MTIRGASLLATPTGTTPSKTQETHMDSLASSFRAAAPILIATMPVVFGQEDAGHLRVKCKPSVAGVFVDGEYQGTASRLERKKNAVALAPGPHRVRVVDPRFEPFETTVRIEAGRTEFLKERLTPKPAAEPPFGELRIRYPNRGAVYLNGEFYGEASEFAGLGKGLLLRPGQYFLRIVPVEEGTPWQQDLTIAENEVTSVNLRDY